MNRYRSVRKTLEMLDSRLKIADTDDANLISGLSGDEDDELIDTRIHNLIHTQPMITSNAPLLSINSTNEIQKQV